MICGVTVCGEIMMSELPLASCSINAASTMSCSCSSSKSLLSDDETHRKQKDCNSYSSCHYHNTGIGNRQRSKNITNVLLWHLVLVFSSLLLSSGLQFPSLFHHRAAPTKQRRLFGVPVAPPPTTTASKSSVCREPYGQAPTITELPGTIINVQDNNNNNSNNNNNKGEERINISHGKTTTASSSPEVSCLSDSWWEDDAVETDTAAAAALAEQKRNRMMAARRELLFDRTHHQRLITNPQRRQHDAPTSGKKSSKGSSASQILMNAICKTAVAKRQDEVISERRTMNANHEANNDGTEIANKQRIRSSRSIIESTISDLLDQQLTRQRRDLLDEARGSLQHGPLLHDGWSTGILGDAQTTTDHHHRHFHHPMPGTILLHPTPLSYNDQQQQRDRQKDYAKSLTVRVAAPMDDVDIALLRLSVFSDYSIDVQQQFCSRSCDALANRRLRGATCVVATATSLPSSLSTAATAAAVSSGNVVDVAASARRGSRPDVVLGTVECSFHEFRNTELGRRRPERSILYITEFAVCPSARRRGIGARLLQAVDELAALRQVESLYLHVDVTNHAALALYNRAGYKQVSSKDNMFEEFTTSLDLHDGATKGRKHFLLCKHLSDNPTWLPSQHYHCAATSNLVLGFEISC